MVMELISRKISTKSVLRKIMYADDLAVNVGGMEGGVQEARTENEPGEDRSDVSWTPGRGIERQVGR